MRKKQPGKGIGKLIKRYIGKPLAAAGLIGALYSGGDLLGDGECSFFQPPPLTTRQNKEDDPLLLVARFGFGQGEIAVDNYGFAYVLDEAGILKYDLDGHLISIIGQGGISIEIDKEGFLFVTDSKKVLKLDLEGNIMDSWDGFGRINGVTVDNFGYIYVADSENRITKIDSEGNIKTQWIIKDTRQPDHIPDLTHDKNNNIYISDPLNNRIQVFNSDGNYLYSIGYRASGITIDNHDYLYTTGGLIRKLTLDGELIWTYIDNESYYWSNLATPFRFSPTRIALDKKNGFVYTSQGYGNVFKFIIQNPFIRGDPNSDNQVNIADAVKMVDYLFNDRKTECIDSHDVNDDGELDLSDPIGLLNYLFLDGNPPEKPFPDLGYDSTPDSLSCMEYRTRDQKGEYK